MPVRLDRQSADFEQRFRDFLAAKREVSADVERATRAIVDDVAARGDAALLEATRKFDRLDITAAGLRITPAEIDAAVAACDPKTVEALSFARDRIETFHRRQLPKDERFTDAAGVELGWRWSAVDAVGLYVPGGTAAYPSSVLMNAVPARVAGVPRVVMVVPAPDGKLNPLVLAAAHLGGVSEIYRVGGAQAVAALAYGTASIAPVAKIVGPGNAYVAAAKRLVFGKVGIDMIAGPSRCWSSPTIPAMPTGSRPICWRRPSTTSAHSRSWSPTVRGSPPMSSARSRRSWRRCRVRRLRAPRGRISAP